MKITAIKQQQKLLSRYSIYVDGKYVFSLSEQALLEQKLHSGQQLTGEKLQEYKQLSTDDNLQQQALRYVAMRTRTAGEVTNYLRRKQASPALADIILNKLSKLGMIDDEDYARRYIADRRSLRPASRRKIIFELKRKYIGQEIIDRLLSEDTNEQTALLELIRRKRKQSKYQDNDKLMQYLARQGFSYGDVKAALEADTD